MRQLFISLTYILLFLMAPTAFAQESEDILITTEPNSVSSQELTVETDELKLSYDGALVPEDALQLSDDKEKVLKILENDFVTYQASDKLQIPLGPTELNEIDMLESLTLEEIKSFLGKKNSFLKTFAKIMGKFGLKPRRINKALLSINQRFYKSAKVVAKSNSKGGTIMFSLSGGLALPQKIVQYLKKTSIGKFIPQTGGFYYLLGLGAGVARVVDKTTGKASYILESFIDFEKLKSTITGIIEVSAAGTYGIVFERRDKHFGTQKMDTFYGGATGVYKAGENMFGWAASTGVSIPPGIGVVLLYTDAATRMYVLRLNVSKYFIDPVFSIISFFTKNRLSCKRIY